METYPLTQEQIQFFRENGYLTLKGVFTEEEMAELREAAEALLNQRLDPRIEISQNDPEYEKIFVQKVNLWRIDERMRKFALHPDWARLPRSSRAPRCASGTTTCSPKCQATVNPPPGIRISPTGPTPSAISWASGFRCTMWMSRWGVWV